MKFKLFASLAKVKIKLHEANKENDTLREDLKNKIDEIRNLNDDLKNKINEIEYKNKLLHDNNLYKLNESVDEKMFQLRLFNDNIGNKISELKYIDNELKYRYRDFQILNDKILDKFLCKECKEMKGARQFWFGF